MCHNVKLAFKGQVDKPTDLYTSRHLGGLLPKTVHRKSIKGLQKKKKRFSFKAAKLSQIGLYKLKLTKNNFDNLNGQLVFLFCSVIDLKMQSKLTRLLTV